MSGFSSRRAREITQWVFIALGVVAVIALLAGARPVAAGFGLAAAAVLVVAVAQSVASGMGRRGS